MNYSHEVEQMCTVAKGPQSRAGPHSRRRQVGAVLPDQRYLRPVAWHRLVRSPAGRLQAHPQCQKRHCRGGAGRDHRLLGHDPFGRHGRGDSAGQDPARMPQHRPGMRCDQRRHARDFQAACIRPQPVSLLGGRSAGRRRAWRILARGSVPRSAPCSRPRSRACATWRWPRAISPRWRWMKTTR